VGRETFSTASQGFPATGDFDVTAVSVLTTGPNLASGTFPGHIGNCVWPGDGCQPGLWASKLAHANRQQTAKRLGAASRYRVMRFLSFKSESNQGIDSGSPPGREIDGQQRNSNQQNRNAHQRQRICGGDTINQT